MSEQQSIVITGASTGIGLAIAERFVREGWRVFGSVRKAADAERLRASGIVPLIFDVTDAGAIDRAAAEVAAALGNRTLQGLVNNAGMAVGGPLLHVPMDELRHQMEVNLIGPARVTQAFAPLLGADTARVGGPGRIVQMSSVAGSSGFPFMGPYVASKHALEGMSESLRRELAIFGIGVSIVAPGAIVTPIWDKAERTDLSRYDATPFAPALAKFRTMFLQAGERGLPASRVADATWHAITVRRPKLRYFVIPRKLLEWTLPQLLPGRWMDALLAKALGLRRSARL